MERNILCVLALGSVLAMPGWCDSTVSSFIGQLDVETVPGSLIPGANENNLEAMFFVEQSDVSFASGLIVDAIGAGLYDSTASLTPGVIAAGTVFSDTYFHSDPVASSGTRFTGSITFTGNILGVISKGSTLTASDSMLAVPGVVYATNDTASGFELSDSQDQFTISSDLRTLTFSAMTWGNVDDLRIITAEPTLNQSAQTVGAPEPGTLFLLACGIAVMVLLRGRATRTPKVRVRSFTVEAR